MPRVGRVVPMRLAVPAQPVQCATCIFRSPREGGTPLRPQRLAEIQMYLLNGTNHLCHSARGKKGGQRKVACRGGREFQLTIWHRLGMISEPTEEALCAEMGRLQP